MKNPDNIYKWKLKKARRNYKCDQCKTTIQKGQKYWRYDARWASAVYHEKCLVKINSY